MRAIKYRQMDLSTSLFCNSHGVPSWLRSVLLILSMIAVNASDINPASPVSEMLADLPTSLLRSEIGDRLSDVPYIIDFLRPILTVSVDIRTIDGSDKSIGFSGSGNYEPDSNHQFEVSYRLQSREYLKHSGDRIIATLTIRPLRSLCILRDYRKRADDTLRLHRSSLFFGIHASAYTIRFLNDTEEVLVLYRPEEDNTCADYISIHSVLADLEVNKER